MTATYDLSNPVGKMRLIIPDNDISSPMFSDEEISFFLEMSDNLYRAAALTLSSLAGKVFSNSYHSVRLADGTSISDGKSASDALLARIKFLEAKAEAFEAQQDDGSFDIAEINSSPFSRRRILERTYDPL